jgi:cell division protein ZapA (FtsZ GTPase activity inhibitor)
MSESNIKVNIAGRSYPLTVAAHEVDTIHQAEEIIEQSISIFQQNYAVKDKQDLLAMAALQVASRQVNTAKAEKVIERITEKEDLTPDIDRLSALVDSYLD